MIEIDKNRSDLSSEGFFFFTICGIACADHLDLILSFIRWLYGQTGCQLYAAAGFFFGIGVIISLGLIILDGFLIIFGIRLYNTARQA